MTFTAVADFESLRRRCTGIVVTPSDEAWDASRQAWNLAVDQRPAAVVFPADEADVVEIVNFAREAGLRVAPQGTGHNAGPSARSRTRVLVKTSGMTGVEVDAANRRARVRAGALWQDVMPVAGAHGLAALGGSSPDVGVVGYSLGGGIGWLARKHGLQANAITAVELVTADGSFVRADATTSPSCSGRCAAAAGISGSSPRSSSSCYPVLPGHGGALVWDWSESERVLQRWAEWAPGAPDEITTSARILQLPPFPDIPEPIRGRKLVMIDGAYAGDEAGAAEVLAPLRELQPEIDMFGPMPVEALSGSTATPSTRCRARARRACSTRCPPRPSPRSSRPPARTPARRCWPRSCGSSAARSAARRPSTARSRSSTRRSRSSPSASRWTPRAAAASAHARGLARPLAPWASGRTYLNFAEEPTDTATGYRPDAYRVLQAIRGQVDPDGLFHANHTIQGA